MYEYISRRLPSEPCVFAPIISEAHVIPIVSPTRLHYFRLLSLPAVAIQLAILARLSFRRPRGEV